MWFQFSLIALLAWAGSDLFSKMGTNPRDKYSHLRLLIFVGAVMGIHAIVYWITTDVDYHFMSLVKYLPVSALYILSMALGYVGLRYIMLSVSSPICNSSGAIVCILCFFFLGDTLAAAQVVAIVLICLGVLLLAILEKQQDDRLRDNQQPMPDEGKYKNSFLAILFPIAYCIIDALGTFADALVLDGDVPFLSEAEAEISYELTFLLVAIVAFIILVFVKKQRFSIRSQKPFAAAAICETVGQFFYVHAISENAIAAAPVIASYCVMSVVLSRIFLKEKLSWKQYGVVAMVFAGIIILGVFDGLAGG